MMGHFLHFYCGSIYTTVYICQNSRNCNALKCWLLLYTNYTSILLLKGKGTFKYLNIGYCIHLDHELKNIKILFWNSSQTWPTSRIPHDSSILLRYDRTHKSVLNHVYKSLSSPQVQILAEFCPFYFVNV